jgi:hypothetical protein
MKKILTSLVMLKHSIDRILAFIIHPHDEEILPRPDISQGELWSLLKMENTQVGRWWKELYPIAVRQFPELRFVEPEELPLTMMVVGPWQMHDLPKLHKLSLLLPEEPINTDFSLSYFGPYKQWLALELKSAPSSWGKAIIQAKYDIQREGLMKPTPYAHDFKAHISLATPRSTPLPPRQSTQPPTQEERKALRRFKRFLDPYVDLLKLTLTPEEARKIAAFWLTSATRPADYHTYIPLEDWLHFYIPDYKERLRNRQTRFAS